jgi:hypothetical protein
MRLCEMLAVASSIKAVNIGALEKEKPYSLLGTKRSQSRDIYTSHYQGVFRERRACVPS